MIGNEIIFMSSSYVTLRLVVSLLLTGTFATSF